MLAQTLLVLALAGRVLASGAPDFFDDAASEPGEAAQYRAETREVTNWRFEAVDALEPKPIVVFAALFKAERPVVTRCVKLNNYWCIKSARWNGEIARDGEGHVGFASADHGADAAATLLRRYYLEFKRKSALDIVRRWAPAECNVATSVGGLAVLAVKGIGGTLRARYLASRRGRVTKFTAGPGPGGKPGRVSMIIPLKTPQYRVPDIAVGMGEKKKPLAAPQPLMASRPKPPSRPVAAASVASKANPKGAAKPETKPQASSACAPDERRLRNYASRMVEGLGIGPTDDLMLFAEDGTPLPNLAHVMLAMSAFELGMLRASPDLVERAVERVAAKAGSGAAQERLGSIGR